MAPERFHDVRTARLYTAMHKLQQLFRTVTALIQDRSHHLHARNPENIRQHHRKLDVRVLQYFLETVLLRAHLPDQLPAVTRQIPQLPDIPRGNETPLQQAAQQRLGQPAAVPLVRLVARNVLHMTRIDQKNLKVIPQYVENRLPVNTRALHGNVSDPVLLQPVPEFLQRARERAVTFCNRFYTFALNGRNNALLVDVKPTAPFYDLLKRN